MINMDSYIIADNEECISFDYFMNRLFEIINDCNHENYLGEVIQIKIYICQAGIFSSGETALECPQDFFGDQVT